MTKRERLQRRLAPWGRLARNVGIGAIGTYGLMRGAHGLTKPLARSRWVRRNLPHLGEELHGLRRGALGWALGGAILEGGFGGARILMRGRRDRQRMRGGARRGRGR